MQSFILGISLATDLIILVDKLRAVRSYLPVVEFEPTAPAALALEQAAQELVDILTCPASAPELHNHSLP